jgi:hypothetical protein
VIDIDDVRFVNTDELIVCRKLIFHILHSGVQEVVYDNQVKLYPNPASNTVQLDAGMLTGSYELRDITGKLVAIGEVKPGVNTLSLTGVATGMYLVRVLDKATLYLQAGCR